MAQKTPTTTLFPIQLFSGALIFLYLSIGFIPNLGAVDKIAPQWLILSCINLFSSIYTLFYYKKFAASISSLFTNPIAIFYCLFFFWAAGSYFYAINPTEALVNIPRHANTLFMMLYFYIFLYQFQNAKKIIVWAITIILGIEVFSVLSQAIEMYQLNEIVNSGKLKGVTANRNITAFSIAVKLPFLIILFENLKRKSLKVIAFFLCCSAIFSLTIIASRASFIAIVLLALSYVFLNCYNYYYNKEKSLKKLAFILIPIILSLMVNQFIFANKEGSANVISRAASIKIDGSDNSINQRLRYYEDVLVHIQKNPFVGVGIGNWKIKSIDYDKNEIKGYVVPYHAHSDFIQLGAELGILGFLLYLGIFFSAITMGFKLLAANSANKKDKHFIFMMLVALGIYLIDANLNFPIARPQVLFTLTLIFALIGIEYSRNYKKNLIQINRLGIGFPIIGILLLIPSLDITNKTYKSLKAQMLILQDFNSNKFNLPLNQIEDFIPSLPNITVTTIPMDAIKARYYFHYKKYDKALNFVEKSKKANPYLRYSEILQSQIFTEKGEYKKAWEMAKIAFENLPRNLLHSGQFINLSIKLKKAEAVKNAFPLLTLYNNEINWKNYLIAVSQLFAEGKEPFISQAAKAVNLFPQNKDIQNLQKIITLGGEKINEAATYSKKGLDYFNSQNYIKAASAFEKAIEINPLEYAHFENAATSNYLVGNLKKALNQIDVVIKDLNPLNGKCEYIKALILLRLGDTESACNFLKISKDSGFSKSTETLKQYCF